MELVLDSIKYLNVLNNISYSFNSKKIVGIYGDNAKYILDIINGDIDDYDGDVIIDNEEIIKKFYKNNPTKIALIESKPIFYTTKVEEEIKFNLDFRKYECDFEKKTRELFNLVGLDLSILSRGIDSLSNSEKYLLTIVINLLYSPEIIMFKDVFSGLDRNSKKKIMMVIKNLKEENKVVIVTSNDTNILYEFVDEVILLNQESIYKGGSSDKIFTSTELMKDKVIPMPCITSVTYLAKNKKVKLSYHKDVRDIIKDIYKHV